MNEPAKIMEVLEELFGSKEAAKNIMRQIFHNAFSELDNAELHVNEFIEAIENNDSSKFHKLINDLFEILSKKP